jgi:hypothetical protein
MARGVLLGRRLEMMRARSAPLLLDAMTDDVGLALSFCKLLSAYAGPCCTIQRSSDNTDLDIGFATDNWVDTAAIASFVGGGTARLKQWYDQKSALHVAQATAANMPTFIPSGMNSRPVARFDGVNDVLEKTNVDVAAVIGSNQGTAMCVLRQNGSKTSNIPFYWITGSNPRIGALATFSDLIIWDFGSDSTLSGRLTVPQPLGWDDAPHVLELYRTTGDVQAIVVDGNTLASATRNATVLGTGTLSVGDGAGILFSGDIAEIITFKTYDAAVRPIIRASEAAAYGITVV